MQHQKLNNDQKSLRRWRERRNKLVHELLCKDRFISRRRALELANQQMRRRKRKDKSERYAYIDLGFESYADYLQSDLWKEIRGAKLASAPDCELCSERATLVHHYSYSLPVMQGLKPEQLFSLCEDCHQKIEFRRGKKRPLTECQKYLRKRLLEKKMGDRVQMICDPESHPPKKKEPKPAPVARISRQPKSPPKLPEIGSLRPPPNLCFKKS